MLKILKKFSEFLNSFIIEYHMYDALCEDYPITQKDMG